MRVEVSLLAALLLQQVQCRIGGRVGGLFWKQFIQEALFSRTQVDVVAVAHVGDLAAHCPRVVTRAVVIRPGVAVVAADLAACLLVVEGSISVSCYA